MNQERNRNDSIASRDSFLEKFVQTKDQNGAGGGHQGGRSSAGKTGKRSASGGGKVGPANGKVADTPAVKKTLKERYKE